ncbi:MAG TPA: hypothetical protein PL063_00945 [Candidatus Cloacimonadota bacterium]|jgi:undecaprenyl pyrophosphate synthase|nr:hypothetical protein [Candidatus Cloacimonadales bacterium]HPY95758.1 hypothetical protein [Candidatus Cloacimonadota bacterium]HQB40288.1 hypothetical protein [Candidatus Cloacimonadota bacterium]
MFDINETKQSPEEQFMAIERLKNSLQENFITFGQILSDVKRKGVYKLRGYKNFKEFIEKEYNIASSFATKLIDTYELYIEELDIDESTLNTIGFDRLNMIKSFVKDTEIAIAEDWIEEAKEKSTPELRELIKEEKEKNKKPKSFKEVFAEQHVEKMRVFFNCSAKELNFKMAIYFQDMDLESVKQDIKDKQRQLEQSGDFAGMFTDANQHE